MLINNYLGIQAVPDMFFGKNRLYIACVDHNILLEFSPIDSLLCSKFKEQRARMALAEAAPSVLNEGEETKTECMVDKGSAKGFNKLPDHVKPLNRINMMPYTVHCHEYGDWFQRDFTKIKDIIPIAKTTDWSFSTPYKGGVLQLSEYLPTLIKET
jgi:hypothetical protein